MAAKLFRVLYDFKAEEDGELTVKSGQLVQLKDDSSGSDGWTLVQMMSSPDSFGYVPSDYVTSVTQPGVGSSAPSGSPGLPSAVRSAAMPDANLAVSRYAPSSSPSRQSQYGGSNFGASALGMSGMGSLGSTTGVGSAVAASVEQEFAQLFASHEEWFRAASAKRADTYKTLLAEASDVLRSVRESESKSSSALDRITSLEKALVEQKDKWSRALAQDAGLVV